MNIICLIKGHIFDIKMDVDFVVCLRCKQKLYGLIGGNTKRPPEDKYIYEKQCRFCRIEFIGDKCSKCGTELYEWYVIGKKVKHDVHGTVNWCSKCVKYHYDGKHYVCMI